MSRCYCLAQLFSWGKILHHQPIGGIGSSRARSRYPEAVSAFQKASDANPDSPVPHLYLALGWFQRYIPGAVSADDSDCARQAETELRRALALDPKSWTAIVMLGQLTFYEGRPEEARQWYRKALDVEPQNAGIWCTLGTIDWQQWLRQGKPAHAPTLDERF